MTRAQLLQLLSATVAELAPLLDEVGALSDEDLADLIVPHLDLALTWEGAPEASRGALEALDGPVLRVLLIAALKLSRRLPDALERARARVGERRARRLEEHHA